MYGCVGGGGVKQKPIVLDSTFTLTDTCFPFILCVWGFTTWLMNVKTIYKITKLCWQRIKKRECRKVKHTKNCLICEPGWLVVGHWLFFCAPKRYKSEWAVHHSPWSCVTVSYSKLSFWKYKSTAMCVCTLNLSTPPFSVSTTRREREHFQFILSQKHSFPYCFSQTICNFKKMQNYEKTHLYVSPH